jgi:hypothetical protein
MSRSRTTPGSGKKAIGLCTAIFRPDDIYVSDQIRGWFRIRAVLMPLGVYEEDLTRTYIDESWPVFHRRRLQFR